MPSKDGPMNLRQKGMGGGRGSGAVSGGGSRSAKRASMATAPKITKKYKPPKTLYHGTSTKTELKKGDRLNRGSNATTYYDFAKSYAVRRSLPVPGLSGTPRVLSVKPSKSTMPERYRDGRLKNFVRGKSDEYKDLQGFVVKGIAKPPKKQPPKMKTAKPPKADSGRKKAK